MTLSVIIPFHAGDLDQAKRLIDWIQSLGPQDGKFYLMTQAANQRPELLPVGWQWMTDYMEVKSEWSKGTVDASGPNAMWSQCAREMARLAQGPWLWLEPDAVPIRRDWLSVITAEYWRGGKPFMGGVAPKDNRMSGVAVYAQNTARTCEAAIRSGKIAFDYAGANDFRRLGIHFTNLIADQFRCEPFKDQADFDRRVPLGTAIHHGDKTGSVYEFAKARLGFQTVPSSRVAAETDASIDQLNKAILAQQGVLVGNPAPASQSMCPEFVGHGEISKPDQIRGLLDQTLALVGDSKPYRTLLYTELQKRGIECGRKSHPKKRKLVEAK